MDDSISCRECAHKKRVNGIPKCTNKAIVDEHQSCCQGSHTGIEGIGLVHARVVHGYFCPNKKRMEQTHLLMPVDQYVQLYRGFMGSDCY